MQERQIRIERRLTPPGHPAWAGSCVQGAPPTAPLRDAPGLERIRFQIDYWNFMDFLRHKKTLINTFRYRE